MQAYDPSTNPLNNNEWSFPLLEIIHIVSIAAAVGTIAIVDLRLLGLGMRRATAAQLVRGTQLWTLSGILVALLSGAVLVTTDPLNYIGNAAFQFKLTCLAAALVYHYTVHLKVATSQHSVLGGRLAAAISIAFWVSVVFGGIFYAFI